MDMNELFISLTEEDKQIIIACKSIYRTCMVMDSMQEHIDLQDRDQLEPPVLYYYPSWREFVKESTHLMCEYGDDYYAIDSEVF